MGMFTDISIYDADEIDRYFPHLKYILSESLLNHQRVYTIGVSDFGYTFSETPEEIELEEIEYSDRWQYIYWGFVRMKH